MSNDCNDCRPCSPGQPIDCQNNEPASSLVNNFINKIIGQMEKVYENGQCVWILPCDLDDEIPGYPREPNEGVLCYMRRVIATGTIGEPNSAANVGDGEGLYASKAGITLQFKSLVAGVGITLSSSADEITIALAYADVPENSDSPGTIGETALDDEFIYKVCPDGKWRRAALAEF